MCIRDRSEEETPEIFTNEEQEAAGETDEELSVFSSEEVPEFDDAPDEAMACLLYTSRCV